MIEMEFRYAYSDNFGQWGWLATCHRLFDPQADARGIVHDFIDHGDAPNYNTVEGELLAFGTILYSRGQFGTLDTESGLPAEIAGFLHGYWRTHDDCGLEDVPGAPDERLDPEDEAYLRRISRATVKSLIGDLRYMGWGTDASPSLAELVKTRRYVQNWLRHGWWAAIRRFPDVSAPRLAEIFEELTDAVRDAKRHVDGPSFEGSTMVLSVNPASLEVAVTIKTPDDIYDDESETEEYA